MKVLKHLEEYENWIRKRGNKEEKYAHLIAKDISKRYNFDQIYFFPHFKFAFWDINLEMDLILVGHTKNPLIKNKSWFSIGIEFKVQGVHDVFMQALDRQFLVDYQYMATSDRIFGIREDLIKLLKMGVGWYIWQDDGYVKKIINAKRNTKSIFLDIFNLLYGRVSLGERDAPYPEVEQEHPQGRPPEEVRA